jgi:hypothetical protein
MNITFNDLIEKVEELNMGDRELFIDIIQKRMIEYRKKEILKDIRQGRKDYKNNKVHRGSIQNLIKEI